MGKGCLKRGQVGQGTAHPALEGLALDSFSERAAQAGHSLRRSVAWPSYADTETSQLSQGGSVPGGAAALPAGPADG